MRHSLCYPGHHRAPGYSPMSGYVKTPSHQREAHPAQGMGSCWSLYSSIPALGTNFSVALYYDTPSINGHCLERRHGEITQTGCPAPNRTSNDAAGKPYKKAVKITGPEHRQYPRRLGLQTCQPECASEDPSADRWMTSGRRGHHQKKEQRVTRTILPPTNGKWPGNRP